MCCTRRLADSWFVEFLLLRIGPPLCEISGRLLLHVPLGYEAKMDKCPQAVLCVCVDVINLCLRPIVPCKLFEKEGKTKIKKWNHPTPETYNS